MAQLDFSENQVKRLLNGGAFGVQVAMLRNELGTLANVVRKRAAPSETEALLDEINNLARELSRKLNAVTALAADDPVRRDVAETINIGYRIRAGREVYLDENPEHDDAFRPLIEQLDELVDVCASREQPPKRSGRQASGGWHAVSIIRLLLCEGWYTHAIKHGVPATDPEAALQVAVEVCFEAIGTDISVEWAMRQFREKASSVAEDVRTLALERAARQPSSGEET